MADRIPAKRRCNARRAFNRAWRILTLYREGLTHAAIAERMGLKRGLVTAYLSGRCQAMHEVRAMLKV